MSVPCKVIATKRLIVHAQDKVLWNLKILQRSSDVLLAAIGKAISEGSSQYFVLWGHVHIYMYISTLLTLLLSLLREILPFFIKYENFVNIQYGKHKLKQKLYTEIVFKWMKSLQAEWIGCKIGCPKFLCSDESLTKSWGIFSKYIWMKWKRRYLEQVIDQVTFFYFLCKSHNFLHSNISDFVP